MENFIIGFVVGAVLAAAAVYKYGAKAVAVVQALVVKLQADKAAVEAELATIKAEFEALKNKI